MIALEANKDVPFSIERVYCILNTEKNASRGFHAHISLKQVMICLAGSCRVVLDNGVTKSEAVLNDSSRGLLIDGLLWREMHDLSDDCVLIVIANQHFDESDYIRDYEEFKRR